VKNAIVGRLEFKNGAMKDTGLSKMSIIVREGPEVVVCSGTYSDQNAAGRQAPCGTNSHTHGPGIAVGCYKPWCRSAIVDQNHSPRDSHIIGDCVHSGTSYYSKTT